MGMRKIGKRWEKYVLGLLLLLVVLSTGVVVFASSGSSGESQEGTRVTGLNVKETQDNSAVTYAAGDPCTVTFVPNVYNGNRYKGFLHLRTGVECENDPEGRYPDTEYGDPIPYVNGEEYYTYDYKLGMDDMASMRWRCYADHGPYLGNRTGYIFDGTYAKETEVTADIGYFRPMWLFGTTENTVVTIGKRTTQEKTVGQPLGELPQVTRTGYTLKGWYTQKDGGTKVTADTIVEGDAVYYTQWTPDTHTATFYTNVFDGHVTPGFLDLATGEVTTHDTYPDAVYSDPIPAEPGIFFFSYNHKGLENDYRIRCYAEDGSYVGNCDATGIAGAVTLEGTAYIRALWLEGITDNTVLCVTRKENRTIEYGQRIGELPKAYRSGNWLEGWYTQPSGGDKISDWASLKADSVYYAHWTPFETSQTPYVVEHYQQQINGEYRLAESAQKFGEAGTEVTTGTIDYGIGFVLNRELSTLTDMVKKDGSTVLKCYYDRVGKFNVEINATGVETEGAFTSSHAGSIYVGEIVTLTLNEAYWAKDFKAYNKADETQRVGATSYEQNRYSFGMPDFDVVFSAEIYPKARVNSQTEGTLSVYTGETMSLSVNGTGYPQLSYQWYKGTGTGTPLEKHTAAEGTSTDSLNINNDLKTAGTYQYWCRLSDGTYRADTALITVQVYDKPTISSVSSSPTGSTWSSGKKLCAEITGGKPAASGSTTSGNITKVYAKLNNAGAEIPLTYNTQEKRWESATLTTTGSYTVYAVDGQNTVSTAKMFTLERIDTQPPTTVINRGKGNIGTNVVKTLQNLGFNIFTKVDESFTLTSSDEGGSGVKNTKYFISPTVKTLSQLEAVQDNTDAAKGWKTYGAFTITHTTGSQIIYVKVEDNAGNVNYLCSDGMVFDDTAPEITKIAQNPAAGTYTTGTVTLTVTASDTVYVNGVSTNTLAASPYQFVGNKEQVSGAYQASSVSSAFTKNQQVTVKVKDKAGNETTQTVTISNIDKLAPTITDPKQLEVGADGLLKVSATVVDPSNEDYSASGLKSVFLTDSPQGKTAPAANDFVMEKAQNSNVWTVKDGIDDYIKDTKNYYIVAVDKVNQTVNIPITVTGMKVEISCVPNIYSGHSTNGWIDLDTGVITDHSGEYPDAQYSELIPLEQGVGFWMYDDKNVELRWRLFDEYGNYLGNQTGGRYTAPKTNQFVRALWLLGAGEKAMVTIGEIQKLQAPAYGKVGDLPVPARKGYTFDGWYTQISGGEKVTSDTLLSNQKVTLYSHWTPLTDVAWTTEYYQQNLEGTGYDLVQKDTANGKGSPGDAITAVEKSYEGYTYQADQSKSKGYISPDAGTTLKMYYNRNSYQITLNVGGTGTGSLTANPEAAAVYGQKVTLTPVVPEKEFMTTPVVTKKGDKNTTITVTKEGNGTYTFLMPAFDVEISAEFYEQIEITKQPEVTAFDLYEKETSSFGIEATGHELSFTWYQGTLGDVENSVKVGENSKTLALTAEMTKTAGDYEYWCRVSDSADHTLDSQSVKVKVYKKPTVTKAGTDPTTGTWAQKKILYAQVEGGKPSVSPVIDQITGVYALLDNKGDQIPLTYNALTKRFESAAMAKTGTYHLYAQDDNGPGAAVAIELDRIDVEPPTVSIEMGKKTIATFIVDLLQDFGFHVFTNVEETFTISGDDGEGSGVADIKYTLSETELTKEQLLALTESEEDASKGWKTYAQFSIAATQNKQQIIYVRVEDAAGNVNILCSDGVIIDITAPVILEASQNTNAQAPSKTISTLIIDEGGSGLDPNKIYYSTSSTASGGTSMLQQEGGWFVSRDITIAGNYYIIAYDRAGNMDRFGPITVTNIDEATVQIDDSDPMYYMGQGGYGNSEEKENNRAMVWFGNYWQEGYSGDSDVPGNKQPILWRTLLSDGRGNYGGAMTLMTEFVQNVVYFDGGGAEGDGSYNQQWYNTNPAVGSSDLRAFLNGYGENSGMDPVFTAPSRLSDYAYNVSGTVGNKNESFYESAFGPGERQIIMSSLLQAESGVDDANNEGIGAAGATVRDKVFALANTADASSSLYFSGNRSRIAYPTANAANSDFTIAPYSGENSDSLSYWLRSPHPVDGLHSRCVLPTGALIDGYKPVREAYGVRPAINLDPTKVLFTEAGVSGGVPEEPDGTGSLKEASGAAPSGYTSEYTGGASFRVFQRSSKSSGLTFEGMKQGDTQITVQYVQAESDSYLSALLVNTATNKKWVSRIEKIGQPQGQASIKLPDGITYGSDNYRLFVWTEKEGVDGNLGIANQAAYLDLGSSQVMTLTFNVNGGSGSLDPQKGLPGSTYNLPAVSDNFYRSGYALLGWAYQPGSSEPDAGLIGDLFTMSEDTTLYAVWKKTTGVEPVDEYDPMYWVGQGGQGTLAEQENNRALVWFGEYWQTGYTGTPQDPGEKQPLLWRTLRSDGGGNYDGAVTLLTEYIQNAMAVDIAPKNGEWNQHWAHSNTSVGSSNIRAYLNGVGAGMDPAYPWPTRNTAAAYNTEGFQEGKEESFYQTAFDDIKKGLIVNTILSAEEGAVGAENELIGVYGKSVSDKVFTLSKADAANSLYFPGGNSSRAAISTGNCRSSFPIGGAIASKYEWGLRTPSNTFTISGQRVLINGTVGHGTISAKTGVRPAINLDPNQVLFTLASETGEAPQVSQNFREVVGTAPQTFQTTYDTGATMRVFKRSAVSSNLAFKGEKGANEITIEYTNAEPDSYLTVMVVNTASRKKWITRHTQLSDAAGSVTVTLPESLSVGTNGYRVFAWTEKEGMNGEPGIANQPTYRNLSWEAGPVSGITVEPGQVYLYSNRIDYSQLTATIIPADASNKGVSYVSSNPLIAEVDNTGKVTGVQSGTTVITAIAKGNKSKTAECTVIVCDKPSITSTGSDPADGVWASGKTIYAQASGGKPGEGCIKDNIKEVYAVYGSTTGNKIPFQYNEKENRWESETLQVENGMYYLYAVDGEGTRSTSASIVLNNIETTKPEITGASVEPSGWALEKKISVTITDEGGSGLDEDKIFYTDSADAVTGTKMKKTTDGYQSEAIQKNGQHYILAYDKAGNMTRLPVTVEQIDRTAPDIRNFKKQTDDQDNFLVTFEVADVSPAGESSAFGSGIGKVVYYSGTKLENLKPEDLDGLDSAVQGEVKDGVTSYSFSIPFAQSETPYYVAAMDQLGNITTTLVYDSETLVDLTMPVQMMFANVAGDKGRIFASPVYEMINHNDRAQVKVAITAFTSAENTTPEFTLVGRDTAKSDNTMTLYLSDGQLGFAQGLGSPLDLKTFQDTGKPEILGTLTEKGTEHAKGQFRFSAEDYTYQLDSTKRSHFTSDFHVTLSLPEPIASVPTKK